MKKQAGFTLVEIAIVMVIIGLLLGGVLKGQQIIVNAKLRNLDNQYNGVTAAIYSYQDRYLNLPGDDAKTATRWGTTVIAGNGDREIGGAFDSVTPANESRLFWSHLRAAGLVAGGITDTLQPGNSFNGLVGVSTGGVANINVLFVGFSKLSKEVANMIDERGDDGIPKTGSIQATISGAPTTVINDYNADQLYDLYFTL